MRLFLGFRSSTGLPRIYHFPTAKSGTEFLFSDFAVKKRENLGVMSTFRAVKGYFRLLRPDSLLLTAII